MAKLRYADVVPVPLPEVKSGILPIVHAAQEKKMWCWAACTEMVVQFLHGTKISQTEIVNRAFGRTDCGTNPQYDTGIPLLKPVPSVQSTYSQWKILAKHHASSLSFQEVKDEIAAASPVQVVFWWSAGGGHVALVVGWIALATEIRVMLNDPYFGGPSLHTFTSIQNGYGLGNWMDTLRFEKVP